MVDWWLALFWQTDPDSCLICFGLHLLRFDALLCCFDVFDLRAVCDWLAFSFTWFAFEPHGQVIRRPKQVCPFPLDSVKLMGIFGYAAYALRKAHVNRWLWVKPGRPQLTSQNERNLGGLPTRVWGSRFWRTAMFVIVAIHIRSGCVSIELSNRSFW